MSAVKRLIDILLSLIGIIIFMPFMIFIALFIKLDSKGPVFYFADRVGKNMKNFKMYKFRTMINTPLNVGDSVCPQYDPRVTTFGRLLRRTKLNELPQFLNVLKGEMTFVGPRPEAPDLAELYPEEAKRVFLVKPGLVGPATILGRNEEELYPPGVDAKKYYIEKILPKKVEIDLKYIKNPSFFKELHYILMGVKETSVGALKKKHIYDNLSQIYLFIADIFLIICSYILAVVICSKILTGGESFIDSLTILPLVTMILLAFNVYFGIYNCLIRYISYHEILGVLKGVTSGSLFLVLVAWAVGLDEYSKMIAVMNWSFLIIALSGFRVCLKLYWNKMNPEVETIEKRRILIFGAGDVGIYAYLTLNLEKNSPFEVVGFISDAPNEYGKKIRGLKVLGNRHHLKALANLYKVEEILLTDPYSNPSNINSIVDICQKAGLRYHLFSSFTELDSSIRHTFPVKTLEFKDLIPRQSMPVDLNSMKRTFNGKTILLNGSGGALGMELCSQIIQSGCKKVIILDRYESYLTELTSSLFSIYSQDLFVPILCDTGQIELLENVFECYRPDMIFHASMRKYMPFLNLNLDDVGQANYFRTFNLAKMSLKYDCEHFVMISSMLASQIGNPITDSLRVAEESLKHFFGNTGTCFLVARICDIIENRGGIISIIENQIREKKSVTLPSTDSKTCLISKYSAAMFILQSVVQATQSEPKTSLFIINHCAPMNLIEVATKIAGLYGLELDSDLPIKYTAPSHGHSDLILNSLSDSNSVYPQDTRLEKSTTNLAKEDLKSLFKDFVLSDSDHSSLKDWKALTRVLVKLCEPEYAVFEL